MKRLLTHDSIQVFPTSKLEIWYLDWLMVEL